MKYLSKTTSSGDTAFPWKLHMVLDESEWKGFDDVISWQSNNAFKVHDPIQFEESVMNRFFNQTRYKSFQRQLNIYGFTRIKTAGKATGSYTHPLFIRGNPDACRFMTRTKIKKKGIRSNWHVNMDEGNLTDPTPTDNVPVVNNSSIIDPGHMLSLEPKPICVGSNGPNSPCNKMTITMPMQHANNYVSPNIVPRDNMNSGNNNNSSINNIDIDIGRCSGQQIILSRIVSTQWNDNTNRVVSHSVHQSHHNYQYPRHTTRYMRHNSNVDLDLDTIFDTDDIFHNKSSNNNNNINVNMNPRYNIFDRNFHMVHQEEVMRAHV